MEATGTLQHTPLFEIHRQLGAKMVPFAGWEMPVQYPSGILAEHQAVRTGAGIFDVSHMGEFEVTGPDRNAFVNRITPNDVSVLESGGVQYSALLTAEGTFVDDCTVYRFDDKLMIVVNASNTARAWEHVVSQKGGANVRLKDISAEVGLLALQGPRAAELLQPLTDTPLSSIAYYHFASGRVAGAQCFISRTGYTGEDGFELFCDARRAVGLWSALMAAGASLGLQPCGLGSRDTLRLEAGMPLYGNELDLTVNPYEANLGRVVKMEKGEFVGRAALSAVQQAGPRRKLGGLVMQDNAIARHGYPVQVDGREVGMVTSGSFSPTLDERIAMAYLPAEDAVAGREVAVVVRERPYRAEQVKLPFYRRPKPVEG